jgi:signal transduction histidine kinase
MIEISIADNGRGFVVAAQSPASKVDADEHHGLSGMCQRMQTIGGKCEITSLPNGGTMIKFVLPLPKNNAQ